VASLPHTGQNQDSDQSANDIDSSEDEDNSANSGADAHYYGNTAARNLGYAASATGGVIGGIGGLALGLVKVAGKIALGLTKTALKMTKRVVKATVNAARNISEGKSIVGSLAGLGGRVLVAGIRGTADLAKIGVKGAYDVTKTTAKSASKTVKAITSPMYLVKKHKKNGK